MIGRIVLKVLALAMAGLATMFGLWAYENHVELSRYRDCEHWTQSPGTLKSLELKQGRKGIFRGYYVVCEYTFSFAGQTHAGTNFTLEIMPTRRDANEAKAWVESALGMGEPLPWRAVHHGKLAGWAIGAEELAVSVRHSLRDPPTSTLTATPPMPAFAYWILIAGQLLLALAAALASLFTGWASGPPTNPLQDAHWCEILFRDHPKARLRAWALSLRYFRFVRGSGGGMDDHGDCLMVALRFGSHQDLVQIFAALGVSAVPLDPSAGGSGHVAFAARVPDPSADRVVESTAPGSIMIKGTPVSAYQQPGRLELSVGDQDKPYDVTAAAVESARQIEVLLAALADRLIDPPKDDQHCVCPKYYPSFWQAAAPAKKRR